MIVVKVGQRGQITIPRQVRRWLSLHERDRVAFVRTGNGVLLLPLTRTVLEFRGSIPVQGPRDFEAIRRQVVEERARKIVGGDDRTDLR